MAQLFERLSSRHWREGLAASVLVAAGLIPGAALAQQTDTDAAELEEVVVTGSRIASPNSTSSSPIVGVSAESLKVQGIADIGDLVHTLPQHITTGSDLSNTNNPLSGPGGITTINLRGLGPQRTLVLVDGKRLGVGDPNTGNPNPSADINQIPAALIQRVDVVTGGASAVYGSDAIAGVANFIMRRDFEGVEIDAQYGFDYHENDNDYMQRLVKDAGIKYPGTVTDGEEIALTMIVGGNFADDRGNATAYVSYLDADPTTLSERDFGACQLSSPSSNPNTQRCGGSANSNYFETLADLGDPNANTVFAVSGNELVEWGTTDTSPPTLFNSNPYMNLKHGRERYQAGVFADFEWSEQATLYTNFMFTQDKANTAVAPSGLFIGSPIAVYCNNSLMSDQQRAAVGCSPEMIAAGDTVDLLIGRRNVEGGPRFFEYEHTSYFAVAGVKGDISDAWSYDVYGSYYDTHLANSNNGYISIARSRDALNGCQANAAGDLVDGCVPYNIWQDGGVTEEATDYIFAYGLANGSAGQEIFAASMTGDLGAYGMTLPTAEDGVGVAFGAEYRLDSFAFLPDQTLGSGDLSGSGGASPTIDNDTDVTDLFVELRVPLVQGLTGVQDLVFEAGYRYSDYELSGGADTYKLGLQWAPIDSLRLRASFNHALRAPTLMELYVPQQVTNTSDYTDPCSGANPTASLEECQRTGMTAAQYGNVTACPSSQCAVLTGGNPVLEPEEADTITVGFTLTPSFLPGFTMSVDWYEIEVENIVSNIPLDVSLDGCLTGTQSEYCSNIVRTPFGTLFGDTIAGGGYIIGTNANIASSTFSGVDVQGSYQFEVGSLGSMVASLNAVYIMDTTTTPLPGEHEYDCAGLYGSTCDAPIPDYRHSLALSWMFPANVTASLQWRYLSSVEHELNSGDETLGGTVGGVPVQLGAELDSMSYFDLSGSWSINDQYTLRLGVNNILDEDPPLVDTRWSGPGTPNTWGPYEALGRQVFLNLNAKF
jgi:iron complex outermembrane receptor protein